MKLLYVFLLTSAILASTVHADPYDDDSEEYCNDLALQYPARPDAIKSFCMHCMGALNYTPEYCVRLYLTFLLLRSLM
ncbi:hypothetical protein A4X06_0g1165 [Tilletia controversa]|uniref:Uncharacterized protein n=1 Tax=Tilletia controversa TaxID=13291 RepID=A0A8X7SZZ7_9BASI|nr:hypothetical protein CF335_g3295 [Tilletia laevis]KAE8253884.1 hypothetical protein A4X06_0g1165 [Tilletia controversa]